jgi:small subunit ribosomal protein S18
MPGRTGGRSGGGGGARGRGRGRDERGPRGRRGAGRRKVCRFCAEKGIRIDYKDTRVLGGFISDRGKIIPSRITGNCSRHQRRLTTAIKRARSIALLPFASVS